MKSIEPKGRKSANFSQLYFIVAAILAVIWGGVLLDIQRARDDTLSGHIRELTNLTLAFSKEIDSSVLTIDTTLIDLREHCEHDHCC